MKKLILASLFALNAGAQARNTVPDSLTYTASDGQTNNIQDTYTWGQDQTDASNPFNRRLVVDSNGFLKVNTAAAGQNTTVTGTISVSGLLTGTAAAYSVTATSQNSVSWTATPMSLTFATGATTGIVDVQISCTDTAQTLWYQITTSSTAPTDNDLWKVYAGGTLGIYEHPLELSKNWVFWWIQPGGAAQRRFGLTVYKR